MKISEVINKWMNPFSKDFSNTIEKFSNLDTMRKCIVVAATAFLIFASLPFFGIAGAPVFKASTDYFSLIRKKRTSNIDKAANEIPLTKTTRVAPKSFTNSGIEAGVRKFRKIRNILESDDYSEQDKERLNDAIKEFFVKKTSRQFGNIYENPKQCFNNIDLLDYTQTFLPSGSIFRVLPIEDGTLHKNVILELEFYRSEENPCTKFPLLLQPGNNHFALAFIDFEKGTLEHYDSMPNYSRKMKKKLTLIAGDLGLEYKQKVTKQLQNDGYQCGAWSMYFLEERLKDSNFDPNQENLVNIENQRVKILAGLVFNHYEKF